MLKFPPLKHNKFSGQFVKREYLPQYDIYKYKTYDHAKNCYTAFVYVHPEILAEKSICNPAGIPRKSLKIDFLRAIIKNEGYGAKMLEFSKIASRQLGCNGLVHLEATSQYNQLNPPHKMYRLAGFSSTNKQKLKLIDKWIKKGIQPAWFKLETTYMYYIPKSKQPGIISGLSKLLKNILHF